MTNTTPTPALAADLSDEDILEIWNKATFSLLGRSRADCVLRFARSLLATRPASTDSGEAVAWARAWFIAGETPAKERQANGRMAWPTRFKFRPVTPTKCLPDDVALVRATPPHAPSESSEADARDAAYQRIGLLEWAVSRWRDEVEHRPLVNKHRRTLDDTWRQVIRFAGGDPDAIIGPSHDAMQADAAEGGAPAIRCPEKLKNAGVCPHHNLQCGWPKCNDAAEGGA